MLHPHTTLAPAGEGIGFGVFATHFIPAGTVTWTLDPLDQRVPVAELRQMPEHLVRILEHYAFLNGSGDYILCWDFARFMNHSCEPAALAPGLDVEIAVRDIHPGEELTGDYGAYNLENDLSCRCGASRCRGTIRNRDFDILSEQWDASLRRAVQRVNDVAQPLWDYIADSDVLVTAASDPMQLPSCSYHRAPASRLSAHE